MSFFQKVLVGVDLTKCKPSNGVVFDVVEAQGPGHLGRATGTGRVPHAAAEEGVRCETILERRTQAHAGPDAEVASKTGTSHQGSGVRFGGINVQEINRIIQSRSGVRPLDFLDHRAVRRPRPPLALAIYATRITPPLHLAGKDRMYYRLDQ
jgi:hypothetical protein